MKAVLLTQAGGSENLILGNIDKPVIKDNEVLVEVKGISINPADVKAKESDELLGMMFGPERPLLLGWDISGIVSEVGSKVSNFKVGDRVFGMINFPGQGKAYAEYVASPEDHLALIPENTSFTDAAATTLAALTALQILKGNIVEGSRVLIQGGAGGVGHFAIQIAKSMGAYVITTASNENKDFVVSLGADEVIDYKTSEFDQVAKDIDFFFDIFGGDALKRAFTVVKEGGKVATTAGGAPGTSPEEMEELVDKYKVEYRPMLVNSGAEDMETLANMLADGTLKANVYTTYPLEEMAAAHDNLASGHAVGKLVVTV